MLDGGSTPPKTTRKPFDIVCIIILLLSKALCESIVGWKVSLYLHQFISDISPEWLSPYYITWTIVLVILLFKVRLLRHPLVKVDAFLLIMKTLYRLLERLLWKIGDSIEAKGCFPFGKCIVKYSLTEKSREIEVYNPMKERYLDRVAEFLLDKMELKADHSSIWNSNGFANEADYLRYRYG